MGDLMTLCSRSIICKLLALCVQGLVFIFLRCRVCCPGLLVWVLLLRQYCLIMTLTHVAGQY